MTREEKFKRLEELRQSEVIFKRDRDFESLVLLHDELIELDDSMQNFGSRIAQKAYCLARLGRKEEASETFKKMAGLEDIIPMDQFSRIITVMSIFKSTEIHKWGQMELNTVRNCLQDQKKSSLIVQVVFDYEDIFG
jgi:hypothetical protein